jgi:hypothetical protein
MNQASVSVYKVEQRTKGDLLLIVSKILSTKNKMTKQYDGLYLCRFLKAANHPEIEEREHFKMLRHKTRFHVMLNINNIKNNGN